MENRIEAQRNYWDRLAAGYDHRYGYDTEKGKAKLARKVARVVEILNLKRGDFVLELGCGTGVYSKLLSEYGLQVIAIDASEGMLKIARQRTRKVDFLNGDAQELTFKENTFDAVVGFYILQYCDASKTVKEAVRVVIPEGKVTFIEPNCLNPIVFAKTKIGLVKRLEHISREATSFRAAQLSNYFRLLNRVQVHYIEYGSLGYFQRVPLVRQVAGSLIVEGVKHGHSQTTH